MPGITAFAAIVVTLFTLVVKLGAPPHLEDSDAPFRLKMTHIFHRNTDGSNVHAMYTIGEEDVALAAEMGEQLVSGPLTSIPKEITRLKQPVRNEFLSRVKSVGDGSLKCGSAGRYVDLEIDDSSWDHHIERFPNVADRNTVVTLAELAANAYVPTPHQGDWTNVSRKSWHHHEDGFGWMGDGVRGYVFVSEDKNTVVISVKGTSAAVFDDGGPTAPNDKINDNLFFSCCCARISYMWNTVCDCYLGQDKHGAQLCDQNCLEAELYREDRYYRGILDVYENVTALYPDAENIWVTGHSLGGALSVMAGRTYGIPTVTFEAPGDDLAIRRLHLPRPPAQPIWDDHVWQFGHNADPIFTGDCSGAGSTCWLAGYAMETKCHSGLLCVYDVVGDFGWHSSIANHRIHVVIEDVLQAYNESAICRLPAPCEDCDGWKFVDMLKDPVSTHTLSTPATPSTPAPTRTTSFTSSSAFTSATTTESYCLTRAWYGRCLEWGTTSPVAALITSM